MAIFLNSHQIDTSAKFPDGTFAFRVPTCNEHERQWESYITWKYESEEEAMALYYLTKYLRRHDQYQLIYLTMYYVPNARMDRVKSDDEVFTLKYFADFINSLHFDMVRVLDVHSSVALALFNNVVQLPTEPFISKALSMIGNDNIVMFYPDEGAMKRYSDIIKKPYGFGVKRRDWRTGKIQGLKIEGSVDFSGQDVLIVDDICCRGGTFYHSAKALKEAGAAHIYLYCTHCEQAIFSGELLTSDMIDGIFTTDSLFSGHHQKITVMSCEEVVAEHKANEMLAGLKGEAKHE